MARAKSPSNGDAKRRKAASDPATTPQNPVTSAAQPTDISTKRPVFSASTPAKGNNVEDEIRRRAYELYEQRGRQDGLHEQDWLKAEAEVRGRRRAQSA